jgi:hypothetical protein
VHILNILCCHLLYLFYIIHQTTITLQLKIT